MEGYILMMKDEKRKNNSFYLQVFVNTSFGKGVDKEFSCKFKLRG